MVSTRDSVASSDASMMDVWFYPAKMNISSDIGALLDCFSAVKYLLLGVPVPFDIVPPDMPTVWSTCSVDLVRCSDVRPDNLDFCASTFYGRIEKPPIS
jgi:hypothetical protein